MTNFKVGDKVMVTNVDKIMYGTMYWKENEVVEVLRVDDFLGVQFLDLSAPNCADNAKPELLNGVPTLCVTPQERQYLVKVLPPNAEPKKEDDDA